MFIHVSAKATRWFNCVGVCGVTIILAHTYLHILFIPRKTLSGKRETKVWPKMKSERKTFFCCGIGIICSNTCATDVFNKSVLFGGRYVEVRQVSCTSACVSESYPADTTENKTNLFHSSFLVILSFVFRIWFGQNMRISENNCDANTNQNIWLNLQTKQR